MIIIEVLFLRVSPFVQNCAMSGTFEIRIYWDIDSWVSLMD
jgi:hypothetical protein